MSRAEVRGKIMTAGGRDMVRSAPSIRRFMRCRATERRATFFDTTTAYPFVVSGKTAVRWGEEYRLPNSDTGGKITRESLCCRGNTKI